jgi:hypothetical protein
MPLPIDRGNRQAAFTNRPVRRGIVNRNPFPLVRLFRKGRGPGGGVASPIWGQLVSYKSLWRQDHDPRAPTRDARHPRLSRGSTCPADALPLAGPASPLILPLSVCRHQASPLIVPRLMTTHKAHFAVGLRNSEGETLCGG